jgi:hypothetical protein
MLTTAVRLWTTMPAQESPLDQVAREYRDGNPEECLAHRLQHDYDGNGSQGATPEDHLEGAAGIGRRRLATDGRNPTPPAHGRHAQACPKEALQPAERSSGRNTGSRGMGCGSNGNCRDDARRGRRERGRSCYRTLHQILSETSSLNAGPSTRGPGCISCLQHARILPDLP